MLTIAGHYHVHPLSQFRVKLSVNWTLVFMTATGILSALLLLLAFNFLTPKSLKVNFATNSSCVINPTIFPGLTRASSDNYHIQRSTQLKLGNFPIYSHSTCISPSKLSSASSSTAKISLASLPLPSQTLKIESAPAPLLNIARPKEKPISLTDQLTINLSSPDKTHNYLLAVDQKTVPCTVKDSLVSCPLNGLALKQATTYPVEIVRELGGIKSQPIVTSSITTVTAVNITSTSITPGALVLDKPDKIIITTDKALAQAAKISLTSTKSGTPSELKFNYTVSDKSIILSPVNPLPRESAINLAINEITAVDSGYLEKPYSLAFTTSGGPKVTSTGLGTYGQSTSLAAVIKFNAKLDPNQNFSQVISLSKGGSTVATTLSAGSTSINLKPVAPLERCADYTISVTGSILNEFGVPSETPYNFGFRTICQEVFSIGASNGGRPITAYKFGNGPSKILFIGATHGDELSSKYILDSWINELEANFTKIPNSRTIIVIPVINPDGVAAGTRVNGRNVDLNRNFPIANWKSDVIIPDKNLLVGGGGSSPLSEPESKALADYTTALTPRLVLTYHSKGGMVVANEAGDSVAISTNYGKSTRFWATSESKLGTSFAYDTTGAYENWLAEKLSIPGLLIELKSHTNNEFQTHKSAMWTTVNL